MGVLFNLEKTTVSVIHKVEKLKYKKGGGNAAEDQNQNHPGSVRDWLKQSIINFISKEYLGQGLIRGRGLNGGFMVFQAAR